MRSIAKAIFPATAILLAATGNVAANEAIKFFEKKIRPVLIEHCYKCHSEEAKQKGKLKGKLRLDLREAIRGRGESGLVAIVPGKTDESNLYRAISYLDPELAMPPKTRLAKHVVADFKRWIEMGAPDPRDGHVAKAEAKQIDFKEARKFWAFRRPNEPTLPTVQDSAWPREDLDFFILTQLENSQLQPAPAAAKRILIRRATYDLTGLPPTMEEIAVFLADKSPDAFRKVVD